MPLPAALAARLAKRGIIQLSSEHVERDTENVVPDNSQEEIIAEDYDEAPQTVPEISSIPPPPETFEKFQGWYACPNKWNVYHQCSTGCRERWKIPKEVDPVYNKKRLRLLSRYPLLAHWQEILDHGIARYYYWNTDTDFVSWYPPGHPKCQVSRSAANLRKFMMEDRELQKKLKHDSDSDEEEEEIVENRKDDSDSDASEASLDEPHQQQKDTNSSESVDKINNPSASGSRSVSPMEHDGSPIGQTTEQTNIGNNEDNDGEMEVSVKLEKPEKAASYDKFEMRDREVPNIKEEKDMSRSAKRTKRDKKVELDPMDPASYSECPRGSWSSGLPQQDEARTGVDSTASGPLFQMRPYPSPGAVLRGNKKDGVGPKKPQ